MLGGLHSAYAHGHVPEMQLWRTFGVFNEVIPGSAPSIHRQA
jgi:hypothetical protein